MPENISSMFYMGEKPWHGLGTKLESAATSAEALEAAGLDWTVSKKPIFLEDGTKINKGFVTVRDDTNQVLGIVGSVYQPLGNKNAFSFFDAVVGIKEAIYHTAGSLGNGECVWILAKLNGVIRVVGDDITEKYLLLTNRHDGSGSVQVMFTPIRVVCQNTLNLALSAEANRVCLRHTKTIGLRTDQVREGLGIIHAQFGIFEEAARRLATVQLTRDTFQKYLQSVGLIPKEESSITSRSQAITEKVTELFETGKGADLSGVRGTLWGAFNAVTEYVDYFRPARQKNGDHGTHARTKSILFGTGAILKQNAWNEAIAISK